jgi:hypothetical protein
MHRTEHYGRTLLVTFNSTLVRFLDFLAASGGVTAKVENYHRFARAI